MEMQKSPKEGNASATRMLGPLARETLAAKESARGPVFIGPDFAAGKIPGTDVESPDIPKTAKLKSIKEEKNLALSAGFATLLTNQPDA